MRVGVLHGGGFCPGANAVLDGILERAEQERKMLHCDTEVLGIPNGYAGLRETQDLRPLQEWLKEAGIASHQALRFEPGCILGTSRENPLKRWGEIKYGIRGNIQTNRIEALIVIGGDDTMSIANRLHMENIVPCTGVPKTIDYDLTVPSFGLASAIQRGRTFVREMRREARGFKRAFVIESMGRDAGWLARGHQAKAPDFDFWDSADTILLPEFEVSKDAVIARTQEIFREKGHTVLVVAEGFRIDGKQTFLSKKGEVCPHNHGRLGGVRFRIEEWLQNAGIETMQLAPGYLYRSGPPTEEDAQYAHELGYGAMKTTLDGVFGKVTVGSNSFIDMATVRGGNFVPASLYDREKLCRRDMSGK